MTSHIATARIAKEWRAGLKNRKEQLDQKRVKKEIGIGSSIEDGSNSSRCRKWIGVDQRQIVEQNFNQALN
jgi:hypothetical protein